MRLFTIFGVLLALILYPIVLLAQALPPDALPAATNALNGLCLDVDKLPGWGQTLIAILGSTYIATLLSNWVPPTSKAGRFINALGGYFRKE